MLGTYLGSFASDTTSELNILGHDGDALGVDRAQVGVLEKTHQVSLRSFLLYRGTGQGRGRDITSNSMSYFCFDGLILSLLLLRSVVVYLQSSDGSGLEPQIGFEILRNFPDQPLERKLADQQLRRLLVPENRQGQGRG